MDKVVVLCNLLLILCMGCLDTQGTNRFVMVWPEQALERNFAYSECPWVVSDVDDDIPEWFNFHRLSEKEGLRVLEEYYLSPLRKAGFVLPSDLEWVREATRKIRLGDAMFYSFIVCYDDGQKEYAYVLVDACATGGSVRYKGFGVPFPGQPITAVHDNYITKEMLAWASKPLGFNLKDELPCASYMAREEHIRRYFKENGISSMSAYVDDGIVVVLVDSSGFECSSLVGRISDITDCHVDHCVSFDLKDVVDCENLKVLDVGNGVLLNIEEIVRMPRLVKLSGRVKDVPNDIEVLKRLDMLQGHLSVLLTLENKERIMSSSDISRYELLIEKEHYDALGLEEQSLLQQQGVKLVMESGTASPNVAGKPAKGGREEPLE